MMGSSIFIQYTVTHWYRVSKWLHCL